MEENKQPTQYPSPSEPTYQTGSTKPPESHADIITFLLSATIFLCGISTILSLMRINLLQKITEQTQTRQCDLSFVSEPHPRPDLDALGFQGKVLPEFWQNYYALPEGVFITDTQPGQKLRPGDLLLAVDGKPVSSWEEVLSRLDKCAPGQQVCFTVFRDGARRQLHITIPK